MFPCTKPANTLATSLPSVLSVTVQVFIRSPGPPALTLPLKILPSSSKVILRPASAVVRPDKDQVVPELMGVKAVNSKRFKMLSTTASLIFTAQPFLSLGMVATGKAVKGATVSTFTVAVVTMLLPAKSVMVMVMTLCNSPNGNWFLVKPTIQLPSAWTVVLRLDPCHCTNT